MISRSSVSISTLRLSWLILTLMHAGMSASIVDRAFLLPRSREEAWGGKMTQTSVIILSTFLSFVLTGFYFYMRDTWDRVFSRNAASSYLLLAVGVADAWHMRVGKQEVECDRQEGQVSHEGEILPVHDCLVQPVREGEPVQSLAHTLQVGVSHTHGQIVIVQTLRRKDRELSLISQMWLSNVVFHQHLQKRAFWAICLLPGTLFRTRHWMRPSVEHVETSELRSLNLELPRTPHWYVSWKIKHQTC